MADKQTVKYEVRAQKDPINNVTIYVPAIVDRNAAKSLATVIENAIDRGAHRRRLLEPRRDATPLLGGRNGLRKDPPLPPVIRSAVWYFGAEMPHRLSTLELELQLLTPTTQSRIHRNDT